MFSKQRKQYIKAFIRLIMMFIIKFIMEDLHALWNLNTDWKVYSALISVSHLFVFAKIFYDVYRLFGLRPDSVVWSQLRPVLWAQTTTPWPSSPCALSVHENEIPRKFIFGHNQHACHVHTPTGLPMEFNIILQGYVTLVPMEHP